MAIPEEIIEEVKSRCDIVEIIGTFVQLKRSGGTSYKGLCPFHQEKTPSFHVDGARQSYHCFGCGKGGNVFRFFMDRDNLTFPEAVKVLASRVGVVIPEKHDSDPGEARARAGERSRLVDINELLCKYFCYNLEKDPDSPVGQYLKRRGLPPDIIKRFRIGAAPEGWTSCVELCRRRGFKDEELLAAGVACRSEKSGRVFDQFRERLTFTIENELGQVVGFSARTLEAKPQDGRKYVNTPDTPIFHKGKLLYALPLARQEIVAQKMAILCEGQLDTIAFHRAGYQCAVAPLGTAFTPEQARILKRYTNRILLAFDADGAGQKAVLRAAEILLPLSMELLVLRMPGGKDPDELFASGGADALKSAVEGAVPWLEVVISSLAEKFRLDTPVGRGEAAAFVAGYLKLIENRVELELYVRQTADFLQVSTDAVYAELARIRRNEQYKERFSSSDPERMDKAKQAAPVEGPVSPALETLLTLAVNSESAARLIADITEPDEFAGTEPVLMALNCAVSAALNGEHCDVADLLGELLIDHPSPTVSRILVSNDVYRSEEQAVRDAVADHRRGRQRERRRELMEKLRITVDSEEKLSILREIQKLSGR